MKRILLALASTLLVSGCGYNTIQVRDEAVSASWSQVLNSYQRRADLIPNLVAVVQGYAAHEKEVFIKVTEARASVGAIKATPELLNDPNAFAAFTQKQGELSGALQRLMVVSERYPDLKANTNFMDLQRQLKETEDSIALSRNRYIKAVRDYNITVRSFPVNTTAMMFGYKVKPNFTVENEATIRTPPKVDFKK